MSFPCSGSRILAGPRACLRYRGGLTPEREIIGPAGYRGEQWPGPGPHGQRGALGEGRKRRYKTILRFLHWRRTDELGQGQEGKESQFCMGELESENSPYLFDSVVNRYALTQPQRHRGTEDDGPWRVRERRGLSSSANSAGLCG